MSGVWKIANRGFLPSVDPLQNLDGWPQLDWLANTLPVFMERRMAREEIVARLRETEGKNVINIIKYPAAKESFLERIFQLYSYFASFYIHATHEKVADRLPKEVAIPLEAVARRLERVPILSYSSYCLNNWKRLDPSKPIELDNLDLLQYFQGGEGRRDERWFILVHVDIEAKAAPAISAITTLLGDYKINYDLLNNVFIAIESSLKGMNKTLDRMTEECSPELYFSKVRPYIFGFNNIAYEGTNLEPVSYRGETGAQSSIIPAIQTVLGIKHQESMLTKHLTDMRRYMPKPHREFLETLETNFLAEDRQTIRDMVLKHSGLYDIYNKCLEHFLAFRKKHLEYAISYIEKKVDNPTGTGGTPYIPWLTKLVEETEKFFIEKVE